jgi:hypothetical protein
MHAADSHSILFVSVFLLMMSPFAAKRSAGDTVETDSRLTQNGFLKIDGQGPRLMLRRVADNWVLIAVKEHTQGVSFRVKQLPKEMEGRTLYRLYSEETQIVRDGGFRDGIRGLGVHVYATSRDFESK